MPGSSKKTGRVYGGMTLAERRAKRREQFIAAGLEVFGTTGFRTATVRGVCREAGLTDRYFYESFDSMEDLLLAVYEACIARFQAELAPVTARWLAADDPRAGLAEGLDVYFRWVEDPRVGRVVWQEVLGVSDRVDAAYVAVVHGFGTMLLGLAEAAGVDWTASEEAEMIAIGATGSLVTAAMQWRVEGHTTPRATMVAAARRVLLGLMVPPPGDAA